MSFGCSYPTACANSLAPVALVSVSLVVDASPSSLELPGSPVYGFTVLVFSGFAVYFSLTGCASPTSLLSRSAALGLFL